MKLWPVTKLDKKNHKPSKKIDDDVKLANSDVIVFSQFMSNLEQAGSRTPDV